MLKVIGDDFSQPKEYAKLILYRSQSSFTAPVRVACMDNDLVVALEANLTLSQAILIDRDYTIQKRAA